MGDPPKKKRLISLCVGCGNQIHDQYILRVSPDLEWHAACLKCAECNQYLDESCTCFVRDGKTYCKRDYIRLYGIKCAKCSIGFSKNDFVMRARSKVYHIECFRCVACSRQLIPGDEFALREDGLFCRADHDVVERASLGAGDPLSPLHPARPLQMAAEPISARQPALRPHVHKQPEKTTRVRTVLNEKQLHTLRTCYAANPRPDALMKEQLVEMTGLSPRVIRVWFQNKRCKDKKRSIMMKQLQQQQPNDKTVNFSEGGPGSNSTGSEVASMSSQLPDTPNSMVASPIEAWGTFIQMFCFVLFCFFPLLEKVGNDVELRNKKYLTTQSMETESRNERSRKRMKSVLMTKWYGSNTVKTIMGFY